MLPTGYHEVVGCHNCRHCFVRTEYESSSQLFCTHDGQPRPRSGSIAMGEDFNLMDDDVWDKQHNEWERWSRDHEVQPFGICGHHARTEETP